MQLDKDTLRKLRGLIIFTLVILVGLWRFSLVLQAVKRFYTSCSPSFWEARLHLC